MANIFQLTEMFKQIVDMADQLDEQTLEDTLESIQVPTEEKVANLIAVVKSIKAEVDLAKDFKKDLEGRIKTMENAVTRINEYILLGVDTVGKPKPGQEMFKKLEIKNAPWVKSAWTQYNPPRVEIVDERMLHEMYLVPQPPKPDTKQIAKHWKENAEAFEKEKTAFMESLQSMIDNNEIPEEEATDRLEAWIKENRSSYEIPGVNVEQSIGIRYR